MANGYGTIADGGRAKKWFVIDKVTDQDGTRRYTAPKKVTRVLPDDVDRDVSYALQQVVSNGTGTAALALGRPAAGKTGTATNEDGNVSSSWFVGYTPQLATAVMYVRGDGNDNLNCIEARGKSCTPGYLVPYFGAAYPARTWTAGDGRHPRRRPGRGVPGAGLRGRRRRTTTSRCRPSPRTPTPESEPPAPSPTETPDRRRRRRPRRPPTPTPTPAAAVRDAADAPRRPRPRSAPPEGGGGGRRPGGGRPGDGGRAR